MRVHAEIAGRLVAVEFAASLRPGFIDPASSGWIEMWASSVDEREDGPIIEEHAAMPGAAVSFAFGAGEFHQCVVLAAGGLGLVWASLGVGVGVRVMRDDRLSRRSAERV